MKDSKKTPGLYVHIPFCRSKCPYCGFYSLPSPSPIPRFLQAIEIEMNFYSGLLDECGTLYLGGGTPTILDLPDLAGLLDRLFKHFRFSPDAEITIEANPSDLSPEKLEGIRHLGVNRVSLGVQSFDAAVLSFLGRRHTAAEAEAVLGRLRPLGFEKICVDLVYGIPGQTVDGWVETLERAASFSPDHLSCYGLTLEPGTRLEQLRRRGLVEPVGEEKERELFLLTSRILQDAGYVHYEISNFARTVDCRSRHNRKYWRHAPYLGLGPSAHSFDGRTRWWNLRSVKKYCHALARGKLPVDGYEILTDEQLNLEALALGLRTKDGVSIADLPPTPGLKGKLSEMEASGVLRVRDGRILPTLEGFLVADRLPLLFGE